MGQRDPGKGFAHVPQFGLRGPHEFATHRRVEKQAADFDAGADGTAAGDYLPRDAAIDIELRPGRGFLLTTTDHQLADFGDRRQRFATEAKRAHAKQVVGVDQLARGMAGHCHRQVVRRHAATVIDHAHQLQPPQLHGHVDPRGPRVDGILHQLFDHTGRALDYFARRNFIDNARR